MNKRTLSVAVALTLAVTLSGPVFAAPTSTNPQIAQVQQQKQDLETKVEKLDNQITEIMKQIDGNKKSIEKTTADIKATQLELTNAENSIKGQQDVFNKRVRAMYINGADSYLGVILESDNLSDFISRVDTVKKIVGFDEKVINDLKQKKDTISKKKEALNNENNKLLALKADNEKKLASFNNTRSEQKNLIASLDAKEKALKAADVQANSLVASAQSQVERYSAASPALSRGASSSASAIVAYASNFQGVPYAWGGNGPSSFDCSGFTCYVFAHFGISLPRIASEQQGVGQYVSRDQLQPGDLVFFGSPAHHVGIYVGNGCMIHAPHTGDVVKISELHSDFSGGRRVK
ncbi:glycoside hydrolase [Clostridium sp. P21]|uniref:Glycoside hydrolase n=1 Tax=Clostridium muellerianum TaxID=2716538 RepID=A0A7Y0EDX0_9CLOT|nr:NlpC/P60 family protein [Clostridium muellerianum]NMM61633.1 glycoside hydrolase [Clostridium muellerianum]